MMFAGVLFFAGIAFMASETVTGSGVKIFYNDKPHCNEIVQTSITEDQRMMMLRDMEMAEYKRSQGDSGLVGIRRLESGTESYHYYSYAGSAMAAIHDHANNALICGLGEDQFIVNGYSLITRHSDFNMEQASTTSSAYKAVQNNQFPPVPPSVLAKSSIAEQIDEMVEYFIAYKNQNTTHRDFKKYFKWYLAYLETAWIFPDEEVDEPNFSERHFIDAETWDQLNNQWRYNAAKGNKDPKENLSFLPARYVEYTNTTDGSKSARLAQLTYRILVHPIENVDLGPHLIAPVYDASILMGNRLSFTDETEFNYYGNSRAARYRLDVDESGSFTSRRTFETLMDKIFDEIPGMDNYGANITDENIGSQIQNPFNSAVKNAAYYHRYYQITENDAMGIDIIKRFFNDGQLYVALNTQDNVVPFETNHKLESNKTHAKCAKFKYRFSYALPMELIVATPLQNWNPHDLEHKGPASSAYGKTVTADGRNGDTSVDKAYNGTNSRTFYRIPDSFFVGPEIRTSLADTTGGDPKGVLDRQGNLQKCRASGMRIMLPCIKGMSGSCSIRQRYPIYPLHIDGNPIAKQLHALTDIIFNQADHSSRNKTLPISEYIGADLITLQTQDSMVNSVTAHTHLLSITTQQSDYLKENPKKNLVSNIITSRAVGHTHVVKIDWGEFSNNNQYRMKYCDGNNRDCWDNHPRRLIQINP